MYRNWGIILSGAYEGLIIFSVNAREMKTK